MNTPNLDAIAAAMGFDPNGAAWVAHLRGNIGALGRWAIGAGISLSIATIAKREAIALLDDEAVTAGIDAIAESTHAGWHGQS